MATIRARKRADGSMRYTTIVRLRQGSVVIHQEVKTFSLRSVAERWAESREVALEDPSSPLRHNNKPRPLAELIRWYIDTLNRSRVSWTHRGQVIPSPRQAASSVCAAGYARRTGTGEGGPCRSIRRRWVYRSAHSMSARRTAAMRRLQARLTHPTPHPFLAGTPARPAQLRPDLAIALADKRQVQPHRPNSLGELRAAPSAFCSCAIFSSRASTSRLFRPATRTASLHSPSALAPNGVQENFRPAQLDDFRGCLRPHPEPAVSGIGRHTLQVRECVRGWLSCHADLSGTRTIGGYRIAWQRNFPHSAHEWRATEYSGTADPHGRSDYRGT